MPKIHEFTGWKLTSVSLSWAVMIQSPRAVQRSYCWGSILCSQPHPVVPSHVPLWQLPSTAGLCPRLGKRMPVVPCSHLIHLWCIRQDGGETVVLEMTTGSSWLQKRIQLVSQPSPFKLSWNGTSVAGHYRSSWKVCVFLAKYVCVPAKASLCCLLLLNPSVCDSFHGHPTAVSFTGFSSWHHVLNNVSRVLWGSLLVWKREGCICGFPTSSISKPFSQNSDAVGEYNLSLPLMLPLSHTNSAKVFN